MRLYVVLGALLALLAAFTGTWFAGRHAGVVSMTLKLEKAQNAAQTRQNRLISRLQEAQTHERTITRTRVEIIRKAQGACLDTRMPDALLRVLPNGMHYRQSKAPARS